MTLLFLASEEYTTINKIEIKQGQVLTTTKELARKMKCTTRYIEYTLKKICASGYISYCLIGKNILVTIKNYSDYLPVGDCDD